MGKRRFTLHISADAVIELDDQVIDVVDDEWRDGLYDLKTPEEIAAHIGYNLVCNRWSLSQLDGWADQPKENAKVVRSPDWEVDAEEIIK